VSAAGARDRLDDLLHHPLLRRPELAALALGALSVLAFAPVGWWWLLPAVLAALLWLVEERTPRQAFRIGAWFGAGLFGLGISWLWHSIHTIGQAPLWLAFIVLAALVAIMALYHGLALWLAVRLAPSGPLRWVVAFPAAWALVEWLRGWLASGFPWFSLGYAATDSPLAVLAPIVGVHGLSAVLLLVAGGLYASLRWRDVRAVRVTVGFAVLVSALVGASRQEWTQPAGRPLTAALVQSNIPQAIKWDPDQVEPTLDRLRALTLPQTGVDLVVWPEAAVPLLWHEVPPGFLAELTAPGRPPLLLGSLLWEPDTDRYYNAVVVAGAEPQFYRKRMLVPFAEVFPVPDWVREFLRLMALPYSDFSRGAAGQPPLVVAGTRIGASVCYEDAFPDAMMDALPEAELLVNVSNDAWFGDSIGPHQHFQIARLRAREAGRPLLRATSTGITAAVDHRGRELLRAPQFEATVLTATVEPRTGLTPFARARDLPLVLLCLAALGAAFARGRRGAARPPTGTT
jgi:apolipoprotein N-acyltransferase